MSKAEKKIAALVIRTSDGTEVKRMPVSNPSPRRIEKIISGLLQNMDTDNYYVDDSEFDGMFPESI